MAHYQAMGSIPPKRHTQHRRPAGRGKQGELYYEELMGEEGFSSDSSLLYHRNIPSTIAGAREWTLPDQSTTPNHPLKPRHLRLHDLFAPKDVKNTDVVTGRRLVLGNGDVRISYVVAGAPSPWYRNGVGDECVYVERGAARVETVFGAFDVAEGDYLVIPRATTHRWLPKRSTKNPLRAYAIEANSHIAPPKRYLSKYGQLLEHAPYCERDLRTPQGPLLAEDVGEKATDAAEVFIKHRGNGPGGIVGTVHDLPFHPLDVVGWDGCLYPYAFNVRDYEPITGRVHQPPPVHQVFEGWNFVICNFVPAQGRLPPALDPGAVLPLERRQRRDHVLRRRRLRGAQGLGHREGLGLGAPRRPRARSAARRVRGIHRRRVLRRARRHGRHLPAARARGGRPGRRRRGLRAVLGPRSGLTRRALLSLGPCRSRP